MDDYHHMFVMAPLTLKGHMEQVVQHWLNPRHDKFKKKEGEKYFETSDDPNILTFRQFINFLTKMTSEIKFGKVHEIQSFSQNYIVVIWSWWLYSAQCNIFKTMRLYSSIMQISN